MRVLVLGGGGFIGSHLVDALIARHEVIVFDNLEPQVHGPGASRPAYLPAAAAFVKGDMRDRDGLRAAVCDADAVVYLAALVGVGQSMYEVQRYVDVNTGGAANLADVLANDRHRVSKVLVASSMSIYGEGKFHCADHGVVYPKPRTMTDRSPGGWSPICPSSSCTQPLTPLPTDEDTPLRPTSVYGITKRDQEELLLCAGAAHGIPTVALRYFNAYGSRQALSNPYTGVAAIFCSRMLNGRPPLVYEDGLQTRDFIHINDLVQANVLALERDGADGQAINVGSGQPVTVLDVVNMLAAGLNVGGAADITGKFRSGDVRHCYADITRARTLLGYEPRVRLADGARELVGWLGSQMADDRVDQAVEQLESRGLLR